MTKNSWGGDRRSGTKTKIKTFAGYKYTETELKKIKETIQKYKEKHGTKTAGLYEIFLAAERELERNKEIK